MPLLLRLLAVMSRSLLWELVLGVGVKRGEFFPVPGCKLALVPANNACPSVYEKTPKGHGKKDRKGAPRITKGAEVA